MPAHDTLEALPAGALRPCYDIQKSYNDNAERGPQLAGPMPERVWPPRSQWRDFLGYRLASPIGIPAGPLLNAKWISFASQMGYDVVTYKTIRSHAVASQPLPNVIFAHVEGLEGPGTPKATQLTKAPSSLEELTITHSFGNPSREADFLQQDIQFARECLHDGQVLIVSVIGTGHSLQELATDYAIAAVLARDAGAQVVEANFAYVDSGAMAPLAQGIVKAIAPTPLVVKVGAFTSPQQQREVIVALAGAGVRGISGLPSIPMPVIKSDGTAALSGRPVADVSGSAIRDKALQFTGQVRQIIDSEKLDLVLLCCGGVMLSEHFDALLQAGAEVAMTATGMMWDPYLAMRWHYTHNQ